MKSKTATPSTKTVPVAQSATAWEPMQVTCVGNLAAVMQASKPGSKADGTEPFKKG